MSSRQDLRVVISCVTFEVAKIVEPIKYYKADKVYLLYLDSREIYAKFFAEVKKQLDYLDLEVVPVFCEVWRFEAVLKEMLPIIRDEVALRNNVYVNVEAGTSAYAAAAIVACMMEGGRPFFVGTKEFTIDAGEYIEKGKPIGMARTVWNPKDMKIFKVDPIDERAVSGLKIWKERMESPEKLSTYAAVIKDLADAGLMKNVYKKGTDRISTAAKMRFIRQFVEKWVDEGWVEEVSRRKYQLTEFGETVVEVV